MIKRFLFFGLVLAVLCSCQNVQKRNYINVSGFTQGSTYSITYFDSLSRNFACSFDSIFYLIDNSMSVYNDSSTISKLNRNEPVEDDSMLADVISISKQISKRTEGAFDITIGPVTRALGFAGEQRKGIDTLAIKKMLQNVGMDKINVNGSAIIKQNSLVSIDLNAIAQGYTADAIANFLEINGVANFIVEVGGEIVADGISQRGSSWIVGVDKPIEGAIPGEDIQVKIHLSNRRGLATSGNYRKFIEVDGQKYSHTINPRCGLPVLNSLLSATVIASNATMADALGTAFMVNGLDWSKNFVLNNPEIEAYLIYSDTNGDFKVWKSDGIDEVK